MTRSCALPDIGSGVFRTTLPASSPSTRPMAPPARHVRCALNARRARTAGRSSRYYDEGYVDRVRSYRGTFPYEKALRKRRVWVEPMFAEAKDWHGLRRFRLRGLEKVNVEALLIASGQNIKRLVTAQQRGPRKLAQAVALRPPDPVGRCRPHLTGRRPLRILNRGVFQQPGKLRSSE